MAYQPTGAANIAYHTKIEINLTLRLERCSMRHARAGWQTSNDDSTKLLRFYHEIQIMIHNDTEHKGISTSDK